MTVHQTVEHARPRGFTDRGRNIRRREVGVILDIHYSIVVEASA
jgi:hypothetical protein